MIITGVCTQRCPLFVLYTFRKVTIKDRIIKHIKAKKRRKYGLFPISRHNKKSEKFNSIPVRVTFDDARKQRRYVVSEFLFSPILVLVFIWSLFSDNRLYSGADRFGSTFFVLIVRFIIKAQCLSNCIARSRLRLLKHVTVNVARR